MRPSIFPQVAGIVLVAPVLRRRYNRSGATVAEASGLMPGDDLVPRPRLGYTRAITINAPVEAVWPWLVGIGQGRAGLYSFDGLENLMRCDIHSLDRIAQEHQQLSVGEATHLPRSAQPDVAPGRARRICHGAGDAQRHQASRRGDVSVIGAIASGGPWMMGRGSEHEEHR